MLLLMYQRYVWRLCCFLWWSWGDIGWLISGNVPLFLQRMHFCSVTEFDSNRSFVTSIDL